MLTTFVMALCLSLGLNWFVREVARNRDWLSAPASDRHIHKRPTPRLGGVGIYVSFSLMLVPAASRLPASERYRLLQLLLLGTCMFAVGLIDDVWQLPAKTKLAFQIACGVGLYFLHPLALPTILVDGWSVAPVVACAITVAWVVLVSNSMNLIDGIDGLAGGSAALSVASVGVILARSGNQNGTLLSCILLGTVLGFLKFNFHPATMFLVDSGSLFLGFMISAIGMQCMSASALASTLPVPVAILHCR